MIKKISAVALVLILCLSLTACGKGDFERRYETESGSAVLDFYKDGTMELYENNLIIKGTYEKTGNNTYDAQLTLLFAQMRYKMEIKGDVLTLTEISEAEDVFTYHRVK